MGVAENVGFDTFPKQSGYLNKRVRVCFNYDTTKEIEGTIVRDDREAPWVEIIKLDDGRYVLTTECQYASIREKTNG